jgi:glycosyltransferase involved in cell wall biosynthesis
MISVIVPARDSAETLPDLLGSLAGQAFGGPWEVLVVNNGSRDGTAQVAEVFAKRLARFRLVEASAKVGAAFARNTGVRAATGEHVAFCDADDVADSEWLSKMERTLRRHDWVYGALDYEVLNGHGGRIGSRPQATELPMGLGFKPYGATANMGISRRLFEAIGGFDEALTTGEDMDFSWRLQLRGYEPRFEPEAVIHYRQREALRGVWRQQVAYGRSQPGLYRRFRAHGLPRTSVARALAFWAGFLLRLLLLAVSPRHRAVWLRQAGRRWGRLVGSVKERVLYL